VEILAILSVIWQPLTLAAMVGWAVLYIFKTSPTQADHDKATYDAVKRHEKTLSDDN
jgi:hypothetical protein